VALSALLLAAVAFGNYLTAWQMSVAVFYLAPILIATWYAGRAAGLWFSVVAVAIDMAVRMASQRQDLGLALWNSGLRLGLFLLVFTLVDHLRAHKAFALTSVHAWPRAGFVAGAIVCLTGFVVLLARGHLPIQTGAVQRLSVGQLSVGPKTSSIMETLAAQTPRCVHLSRPVLLGSRDPGGASCVRPVNRGDVREKLPTVIADFDGGPGTRLAGLLVYGRAQCKLPSDDYAWHQGRFRVFLEELAEENAEPMLQAQVLADQTRTLAQQVGAWDAWRDQLGATAANIPRDSWPGYCLAQLNQAVAARDLGQTKRWSAELASAALTLADLHRWLDFLAHNQLAALDFQAQCWQLFTWADTRGLKYDIGSNIDHFPGGLLTLHGTSNYNEVEYQAEGLFCAPDAASTEMAADAHATSGSVWVSPCVRECFVKVESQLSPANRATWELAAKSPYEHSYLINMLDRAWRGDAADQLCEAVRRFDANYPHATVAELMGVLMYRGHSFGGLEWADRYQGSLMNMAGAIHGPDREAFFNAYQQTFNLYHDSTHYGPSLTLREALAHGQLDCNRATDMIGALYRNSGQSRFGHVRWCAGAAGHSVAAAGVGEGPASRVLLADGLTPMNQPETWPQAYFQGHAWPAGLQDNPPPFAAELYLRGLDNYVWVQGYIIRGPSAGTLTTTAVPYLPHWQKAGSAKVYGGPYPQ
jgi:hypothetical protein